MVCLSVVLSERLNILSCKGLFGFPFSVLISPILVSPFRSSFEKCQLLIFMIRLIYLPTVWCWLLDSSMSPWSLASSLWLSQLHRCPLGLLHSRIISVIAWLMCVYDALFSLGFLRVSSETWRDLCEMWILSPYMNVNVSWFSWVQGSKLFFLNIKGITYLLFKCWWWKNKS